MAKKKLSFEAALERLEEVVSLLESGDTTLEKAVELYKEGVTLSKQCDECLKLFEKEVTLLYENENGGFVQQPFEIEVKN